MSKIEPGIECCPFCGTKYNEFQTDAGHFDGSPQTWEAGQCENPECEKYFFCRHDV